MATPRQAAGDSQSDWPGVRLHVVTGKGGAGKTTIAGALALALAADGRRTLVVEVEGRQGLAQLFDTPPMGYAETRLAAASGGGEVYGLAVDAEDALLEYLQLFYRMRGAGRILDRAGIVDFATTIAPGMRDVLLTGKVYEAVGKRRAGRKEYDSVDPRCAPDRADRPLSQRQLRGRRPRQGRSDPGPRRLDHAAAPLPATAVHLVTLLEEMPVQETADAVAELEHVGLPVGAVMVNMLRAPTLRPSDLTAAAKGALPAEDVRRWARRSRPRRLGQDGGALLTEAGDSAVRTSLEKRERRRVTALARPTYNLPWLVDGVDLGGLYELATALTDQGAA